MTNRSLPSPITSGQPVHGRRLAFGLALLAVTLLVLLVYWPVTRAGFVWDDLLTFEQRAWLHHGDAWKRYIFTGFNDWTHYFRPLVVGLFVAQVRLFGGAPEPMHMVSLGMHLVNVALVVFLARSLADREWKWASPLSLLAGLLYGLHPMLVESVTWIGCQFDQVQVITALAGLLFSRHIQSIGPRTAALAGCFLLSALSKESAASFPAIVFLFDWLLRSDHTLPPARRALVLLRANWPVYAALLLVGLGYLLLRRAMMGATVAGLEPWMLVPDAARLDSVAYVYLKYWAVILGVPTELNPLHPVGSVRFGVDSAVMTLRMAGAACVGALGLLVVSKRFPALGVLVLSATLYLLPVLGIVPVQFDGSIYHERYAIGAIALTAVLLPRILGELRQLLAPMPIVSRLLPLLALAWLSWAVPNVRATIPLWSDNVALWEWTVRGNPGNSYALGNLVSAYVRAGKMANARALVRQALAEGMACDNCYLNGLMFAVRDGDRELIDATLEQLRESPTFFQRAGNRYFYFRTIAHLELRLGNPESARMALREAIQIEDQEPFAHLLMAEIQMALGEVEAAKTEAALAVALSNPMERADERSRAALVLAGKVVNGTPMR